MNVLGFFFVENIQCVYIACINILHEYQPITLPTALPGVNRMLKQTRVIASGFC